MRDAPVPAISVDGPLEGGFSRRALAWMICSVAVSFLAAILIGVYGKDPAQRLKIRANTFSYSALGYRAVAELLESMKLAPQVRPLQAGGIGPRVPLILAEPDDLGPARLQALLDEAKAEAAPLVLVVPKWRPGAARQDNPEWLARVDRQPPDEILRRLRALGIDERSKLDPTRSSGTMRCRAAWRSRDPLAVDLLSAQLFAKLPPGLAPLVECGDDGVLVAWRQATERTPQLVLISDPDLLNNHGLDQADNAVVFFELLTRQLKAEGVVFDETIHGFHSTLLQEALRFPLVLGLLQGLLLLGVILWAGMGRFGKPLPPPPALAAGKELLIDNTARLLASGGYAADALFRYFRQTTRTVAAHYLLSPDLPDRERLVRLQRFTDARDEGLNLAALERSASQLSKGRRGGERAVAIARRLHDWRLEMINGHRDTP